MNDDRHGNSSAALALLVVLLLVLGVFGVGGWFVYRVYEQRRLEELRMIRDAEVRADFLQTKALENAPGADAR